MQWSPDVFKNVYAKRRQKVASRMLAVGVEDIGDTWALAHKNQRRNAVVLGISVATIMLGATLSVIKGLGLEKDSAAER